MLTYEAGLVSTSPDSWFLFAKPYIAKLLMTWSKGWIFPLAAIADLFKFVTYDLTITPPCVDYFGLVVDFRPNALFLTDPPFIELPSSVLSRIDGSGSLYILGCLFSMKLCTAFYPPSF